MSRKLESKESHCFYIEDAQNHGVDKATILYNIRFWLNKEMANYNKGKPSPGKVQDGYVWTYNSAEAFSYLIPYFSPNKIQKLLKQLENDGVILTGKFNQKRYDKTKWYTMEEYSVEESLQPNGGKDSAKRLKEISQTAEPIPDINTDKKPDTHTPTNVDQGATKNVAVQKIPYTEIISIFHFCLPSFPSVRILSDERKRKIQSIWNMDVKHQNTDFWRAYFKHVSRSPFLMGETGRGGFGIDFLITKKSFIKIIEGNYHGKGGN
jgi:hypothetical protein